MSKLKKARKLLLDLNRQVTHLYRTNNDIYSQKLNDRLLELKAKSEVMRKEATAEDIEKFVTDGNEELKKSIPKHKYPTAAEYLDIILIAFALAFSARALFLQPFKIPTGSMQPTLHGIVYTDLDDDAKIPSSKIRRGLDYLYYGRRYVDLKMPAELDSIKKVSWSDVGEIPYFNEYSAVSHGNKSYVFPGSVNKFQEALNKNYSVFKPMADSTIKGYIEQGDHLFVDRVSFNFREPRRGDITVFTTTGLTYKEKALRGMFFIKRLVALPGNILKIQNDAGVGRLYIKEKADSDFKLMNSKPFKRMYSKKNGYAGYEVSRIPKLKVSQESQLKDVIITFDAVEYTLIDFEWNKEKQIFSNPLYSEFYFNFVSENSLEYVSGKGKTLFIKDEETGTFFAKSFSGVHGESIEYSKKSVTYTMGKNQFFMMGDNSFNSKDSRYFGPVLRKYIVGQAYFIWWPFSKRWGMTDIAK